MQHQFFYRLKPNALDDQSQKGQGINHKESFQNTQHPHSKPYYSIKVNQSFFGS
jgi:hypothetical protein